MTQSPGSWKIIRVNGDVEERDGKPTLKKIHDAIGCDCIDCVLLDEETQTLMAVDDEGLLNGKSINPAASRLYAAICRPKYKGEAIIKGDVAIINDQDFV